MKNRLDRVNELIKRELGELIRRQVPTTAKLVTVKQVDIAPDLKNATVWIGIIGTDEEAKESMGRLQDARKELQREMARRVILKYTPHLHFKLDQSGERGDRILQIISELQLPKETPNDEVSEEENENER
jgi:ribosome-binding factor A